MHRLVYGGHFFLCGKPRLFEKAAIRPRFVTCPSCRARLAAVRKSAKARAALHGVR